MSAVASLGMYDAPALQAANDSLWAQVVLRLRRLGFPAAPDRLERGRPLEEVWRDPDLLLAQTCGYPLATILHRRVRLVCTPVYSAPGCDGPLHRAAVLVRIDDPALTMADLRGGRCAVNDPGSNTGCNLLRRLIADVAGGGAFLGAPPLVTGAHRESLAAVAEGRADFAALDCVTLAHLARDTPEAVRGTRILRWTGLTPGLPLVTGANTPPDRVPVLRQALRLALRAVGADVRARLMLQSFAFLPTARYAEVTELEREAAALGYPALC